MHIRDNHNLVKKKLISLSVIDYQRNKKISDYKINKNNLESLKQNLLQSYKDTKYYKDISDFILLSFEENIDNYLSEKNINLIKIISKYLNIKLNYTLSSNLLLSEKKKI